MTISTKGKIIVLKNLFQDIERKNNLFYTISAYKVLFGEVTEIIKINQSSEVEFTNEKVSEIITICQLMKKLQDMIEKYLKRGIIRPDIQSETNKYIAKATTQLYIYCRRFSKSVPNLEKKQHDAQEFQEILPKSFSEVLFNLSMFQKLKFLPDDSSQVTEHNSHKNVFQLKTKR